MLDKIKIGWKDYEITITNPETKLYLDGRECYGTIDYVEQTIHLRESNNDDQMMETFIHEVLHGIGNMYEIESLKKEKLTSKLASALYTVLKDNNLEIKRKEVKPDA